jgi:hypothetical protein
MKISNLPKTATSSDNDLISIVQGGVTKSISKQDLLGALSFSLTQLATDVASLKTKVSKNTVSKDTPVFNNSIIAPEATSSTQLTTKGYVDGQLFNTVKNDGSTKLLNSLSFLRPPENPEELDLVYRGYVDAELQKYLGVPQPYNINAYPATTTAGECFIMTSNFNEFATNGPEIQSGDILICLEPSVGGTHGEVGTQFAILNTNVVIANETTSGTLRVSTVEELTAMNTSDSAITPLAYKRALEDGSEFNRTFFQTPTFVLTEADKGIVAVDTRRNAVTVTLPSIGSLDNPKLVKYTIKDEFLNALTNTITVNCLDGNTIQGSQRYLINSSGGSVTFYNDTSSQWYIESNVFSATELSTGVKSLITDDVANGEQATSTGAYEAVLSTLVDLRDYPVGTGFKVVASSLALANGNNKTVALGIDGTQYAASSLTGTTAPNNKFIHHEFTVMHTAGATHFGFGFVMTGTDDSASIISNTMELNWNTSITVSCDVNNASAAGDIQVYALQIIPLK